MKLFTTFEGVGVDQMYREHILDHYHNPRNFGTLENAERFHDLNPLCGDEIEMFVKFENGKIADIRFTGRGCAISQASASMLTDAAKGKGGGIVTLMNREGMQELVGIEVAPMRVKCMMLPLKVLKTLVYMHEGKLLEGDAE